MAKEAKFKIYNGSTWEEYKFPPIDHTHDYLPLSGGTLTGGLTLSSGDMVANYVRVKTAAHETGSYDKIATLSSTGYIRYRKPEEVLSDIGAATKKDIEDAIAALPKNTYYIEGTGTTAGVWLGSHSDIKEYYNGLTILYKIGIAGIGGDNPTTLNINDLGATPLYLRGTTRVTTHYAVNTVIQLVYTTVDGAGRWYTGDYDTNTTNSAASGNTSSKIFLIGRTSQSTTGGTTYSHDTVYVDTSGRICGTAGVYTNKLVVPTTSGGSTYGVGTSGQILKSNGTTSYWGNETTYSAGTGINIASDGTISVSFADGDGGTY